MASFTASFRVKPVGLNPFQRRRYVASSVSVVLIHQNIIILMS